MHPDNAGCPRSESSRRPCGGSRAKITGTFKPMPVQHLRDADERSERFLVRRRIHDDVGIARRGSGENSGESSHPPEAGSIRPAANPRSSVTHRVSSARRESLASGTPMLDHSYTANAAVQVYRLRRFTLPMASHVRAALAAVLCLLAVCRGPRRRHVPRSAQAPRAAAAAAARLPRTIIACGSKATAPRSMPTGSAVLTGHVQAPSGCTHASRRTRSPTTKRPAK